MTAMCGSPCLECLGQPLPLAIAPQHLCVPLVLQGGGHYFQTVCVCVTCVGEVVGDNEVKRGQCTSTSVMHSVGFRYS